MQKIKEITAKTFGTEYDPESFVLPEKNVIVTKHNFSKASAILTIPYPLVVSGAL